MAAKMAAIFIENARTPLKSCLNMFFVWFWAPIVTYKKIGINIHFNVLLGWPDIKFLCHWP